jgi:hypothetical protein
VGAGEVREDSMSSLAGPLGPLDRSPDTHERPAELALSDLLEAVRRLDSTTAALTLSADRIVEETRTISARLESGVESVKAVAALQLLEHLKKGTLDLGHVFGPDCGRGTTKHYVICNSVPKSGTYLLLEVLPLFGVYEDTHYHAYTNGISRVLSGGKIENLRAVPAFMWAAALRSGMMCAAHVDYSPYFEDYLLSRKDHKMLFMVRDPRDIVISWVDFVYYSSSYIRMRALHQLERDDGNRCYPDDAKKITSMIQSMTRPGIASSFSGWMNSPACLTVRFEDLYGELTDDAHHSPAASALEAICDYLELPRRDKAEFRAALGRGLTSSGRADKIGVHKRRMNADHFKMMRSHEFQRLVVEMGYPPTE